MKKIIRVFPSKTNATPDDNLARVRQVPGLFDEADEIHISVTFTWDIPWAEWAAEQWKTVAPVKVGGVAYNEKGGDFIPGMYLKKGYVITSRGCPNRCWFCSVPKREGGELRELPITDGWIVTDDNLLACSEKHINAVFEMLRRQPEKPHFTGGMEAALLTQAMAVKLFDLKPRSIYFAYDTPNDLEPLIQAGNYLFNAGFKKSNHVLNCYVLCGYKGDTYDKAIKRMSEAWKAGFIPMPMVYRDRKGELPKEWQHFKTTWTNKKIITLLCKQLFGE